MWPLHPIYSCTFLPTRVRCQYICLVIESIVVMTK
ncbi:hypothetical protein RSAG8_01665, partial [Rhizoctonia solani AG-8 WAC10335]